MGWAEGCSLENYRATSLLGLSPRLEWGTVVDLQAVPWTAWSLPLLTPRQ